MPVLLQQLRKLFEAPAALPAADELHLAVAVLLVEAARMDDTFGAEERRTIEKLLTDKFALSPGAAGELIDAAEEAATRSTQLHPFTRTVFTRMAPEQRILLIEMLWEVAYADGVLDPDEDMLLRKIAGLIYVSDADRVEARRRVLARLKH